jgi:hypothetical protein
MAFQSRDRAFGLMVSCTVVMRLPCPKRLHAEIGASDGPRNPDARDELVAPTRTRVQCWM